MGNKFILQHPEQKGQPTYYVHTAEKRAGLFYIRDTDKPAEALAVSVLEASVILMQYPKLITVTMPTKPTPKKTTSKKLITPPPPEPKEGRFTLRLSPLCQEIITKHEKDSGHKTTNKAVESIILRFHKLQLELADKVKQCNEQADKIEQLTETVEAGLNFYNKLAAAGKMLSK